MIGRHLKWLPTSVVGIIQLYVCIWAAQTNAGRTNGLIELKTYTIPQPISSTYIIVRRYNIISVIIHNKRNYFVKQYYNCCYIRPVYNNNDNCNYFLRCAADVVLLSSPMQSLHCIISHTCNTHTYYNIIFLLSEYLL